MHGHVPQKERGAIMAVFRSGATWVLITIHVWARGADVQQVTFLFLTFFTEPVILTRVTV